MFVIPYYNKEFFPYYQQLFCIPGLLHPFPSSFLFVPERLSKGDQRSTCWKQPCLTDLNGIIKIQRQFAVLNSLWRVRVTRTNRKNMRNEDGHFKKKESQMKKYFNSKTISFLVTTPYYFCSFNHNLQLFFFPQTSSAESCKT